LESTEILITALTLGAVFLTLMLPGPRHWLQSMRRKPFAAFLITLAIIAVSLGIPRGAMNLQQDPVDTVRAVRIVFLLLMAIPALLASVISSRRTGDARSLSWLMLYALIAMASASYSLYPLLSFYKGFEVAVFVILGLYIGNSLFSWMDVQDIINILLFWLWYYVVSALIGGIVAPSMSWVLREGGGPLSNVLTGVIPDINANTLTQVSGIVSCCLLAFVFHVSKMSQKIVFMLMFFVAILCAILSHSRTSLLAILICILFIMIMYKKKNLLLIIGVLSGPLFLFFALSDVIIAYFMRGQTMDELSSLSGRMYFWPLVLTWVYKSPFIGHGFYSSQKFLLGTSTVDNTYLEVLLGIGIVGLSVFCVAVLAILINLWRARPWRQLPALPPEYLFVWTQLVVIFLFLFFRSLTGPSFQILHINLVVFILVTVCAAATRRLVKETAAEAVQEENIAPPHPHIDLSAV